MSKLVVTLSIDQQLVMQYGLPGVMHQSVLESNGRVYTVVRSQTWPDDIGAWRVVETSGENT